MADLRKYVAVRLTTLSEGIDTSDLSCALAEIKDRYGNDLTMADFGDLGYGVFEPGTAGKEEHFTFDGITGTTLSIAERGVEMKAPYTANSANVTDHSAGTTVILYTNSPKFYDSFVNKKNDETIEGKYTFPAANIPEYDSEPAFTTGSTQLPTVKFVEDTASAAGGITPLLVTDANSGTDVNIASGRINARNAVVSVSAGSLTLPVNDVSYVEVNALGTISSNTTGFTDGNLPLAEVTTDASSVTNVIDRRGWFTLNESDKQLSRQTYGDTIAVGEAVYLDTADNKWKLADASAEATCEGKIAVALEAGVDTDTNKIIQTGGVVTGLSGLTAGWVYVSDTAGALSATPGTYKKVVGYAINATTLILMDTFSVEQLSGTDGVTEELLNTLPSRYTPVTLELSEDIDADELVKIIDEGGVGKFAKVRGQFLDQAAFTPTKIEVRGNTIYLFSLGDSIIVQVATLLGSTLTFGSSVTLGTKGSTESQDAVMLTDTDGIAFHMNHGTPGDATAYHFSVSGTTVTSESSVSNTTEIDTLADSGLAKLSDTRATVFGADGAVDLVWILDISGVSISQSVDTVSSGTYGKAFTSGEDDYVIVADTSVGRSLELWEVTTVGAERANVAPDFSSSIYDLVSFGSGQGYFVYEDNSTADTFRIAKITCTFSPGSETITATKVTTIVTGETATDLSVSVNSYGDAVVCVGNDVYIMREGSTSFELIEKFTDAIQTTTFGTKVTTLNAVISRASDNIYVNYLDVGKGLGFLQTSGVDGNSRALLTTGEHDAFSGLEIGRDYYVQDDGSIDIIKTENKVGTAISSTALNVSIDNK